MDQENAISDIRNKSKIQKYDPIVFRQYDRDLLDSETITLLENALNKKGRDKGIINYKVKFLPVCEVENFLVLAKSTDIADADWTIVHATSYTKLEGMITYAKKILDKIELDTNKIFKEACSDKHANYAGKEFLRRLNPKLKADHISKLTYEAFPQPLKDYLGEIKSFFDNSSTNHRDIKISPAAGIVEIKDRKTGKK